MKPFLPLAFALAAATPAIAAPPAPAIPLTIAMTDHGFVPHLVNLRHGARYVIRFVNRSGRGHDFTAPDFFASAHAEGEAMRGGKIDLDPGQSAVVRLTAPEGPGRFPFKSEHVTDALSGLSGYVVIR